MQSEWASPKNSYLQHTMSRQSVYSQSIVVIMDKNRETYK